MAVSRRKRPATFGKRFSVRFITVSPEKLEDSRVGRLGKIGIASVEKAILDSFDRPELAGGMVPVISALKTAHLIQNLNPNRLVRLAIKANHPMLNRRLGYVMDALGIPGTDPLTLHLGRKFAIPLTPGADLSEKALYNSRWRLYEDPVLLFSACNPR